jgi:secreted trypsin-like serine protease
MISSFAIVVGLLAQNTSTTVDECNDDKTSCGCSRRPDIILKISGGKPALHGRWGWVVSLRDSNHHFCTGSILNEWYIVTAAHCLTDQLYSISKMTVCAGTFRLSDPCHQSRTMSSIIFHPLYNSSTDENDIALVRLKTPFDLSDSSVTPICLPNTNHPNDYSAVGTKVVSIGWGDLVTNETADALHEVTLTIRSDSSIQCQYFSNHWLQLCAGGSGLGMFFSHASCN